MYLALVGNWYLKICSHVIACMCMYVRETGTCAMTSGCTFSECLECNVVELVLLLRSLQAAAVALKYAGVVLF